MLAGPWSTNTSFVSLSPLMVLLFTVVFWRSLGLEGKRYYSWYCYWWWDSGIPESTQLWSVIHVDTWTVFWILECTIFLSYPGCYHVLLVTVHSERGEAAEICLDGGHLPPEGFPRLQARTVDNVALWWCSDPSSRFHNLSTSPEMSLLVTVVTTVW